MDDTRTRDFSLTTALCLSLFAHAFLLYRASELYSSYAMAHLALPPFEFSMPDPSTKLVVFPELSDPWKRLGDSTGTGNAIAESPGPETMVGLKASQVQPFLSLDAVGQGNIGDDPSESVLPKGAAASAPPTPDGAQEAQPGVPAPFGYGVPQGEFVLPIAPQTQLERPGQAPQTAIVTAPPTEQPGASESADPAPPGRLESDPTTLEGGAEFRAGGTRVRLGRAAKITRPRMNLAARADLMNGAGSFIVLKLTTDITGNVTNAEVYRSSGSNNIDQPCKLAAYNWWFEPPKDSQGKPVDDVFLFSIRFL